MASDLLGIASSAIMAFQQSLATTGHNIANANTPGYSRQTADLTENQPLSFGSGYVGTGVQLQAITRSYDNFLTTQVRTSTSAYSQLNSYSTIATQIDNVIADKSGSLSPMLQSFFNSVQGVVNQPTSMPVRQAMLTSAQSLQSGFNSMSQYVASLSNQVNQDIPSGIEQVNSLAGNLAAINQRISQAMVLSPGNPPNDLLDQRDQLLLNLSKQVDIQVLPQQDGTVNVTIGSGQALVMGTQASSLKMQNSSYAGGPPDIALYAPNASSGSVITNQISGGNLGGLISVGNQVITPVLNQLGRVAAGLALQFNAVQTAGYGLDGSTGANNSFFAAPTVIVQDRSGNTGSLTASITDANALTADDYRVDITAAGAVVTNLATHAVSSPYSGSSFTQDGVTFNLSPPPPATAAAVGDSFIVQPTRDAAGAFQVVMTDPAKIGASASNTNPVTLPNGTVTTSQGDNLNAVAMANLQSSKNLLNGQATYDNAYSTIVGDVGTWTQASTSNTAAQKTLLDNVTAQQASVSGVNLDEEAANLVNFQQAYQAAAQTVAAANTTFAALLTAVGK